MKYLKKYHKQKRSKLLMRKYESLNKAFDLKLDLKDERDLLSISVFATALFNKNVIEKEFDRIHNDNIDLWDNLAFKEKNFIFQCDGAAQKAKLHAFEHDGVMVYIPCFDTLLNSLYDRETAILELPQYYKLYTSFKNRIVPLDFYGKKPYKANMASAKCVGVYEDTLILYDATLKRFYKLSDTEFEYYPILSDATLEKPDLEALAKALGDSEDTFIDLLIERAYISAKAVKKIEKKRAKLRR